MKKLAWDVVQMTRQHPEGSFATQADRWRMLDLIARDLDHLGYKGLRAKNLKVPHIAAVIHYWQDKGLSTGTIKNRMSCVRWWANKVGNRISVPSNFALGIPDRVYVSNVNKAQTLDDRLLKVNDVYVRMSLELQVAFGLRREEAIK